jgi:hypothetical protein
MSFLTEVLSDSPTHYWIFDSPSGATAVGSIVSKEGGTGTGAFSFGSDPLYQSGASSASLTAAHFGFGELQTDSVNPLTVEALIRLTDTTGNQFIFGEGAYSNGYALGIISGSIRFGIISSSDLFFAEESLANLGLGDGDIVHIVGVLDVSSGISLYVNGSLAAANADYTGQGHNGSFHARAGCCRDESVTDAKGSPLNGSQTEDQFFIGDISEIAVYKAISLSSARVTAHYEAIDLFGADEGSSGEGSVEIAGAVTLDGSPVQADLYLVDLAQLTPVQSYALDGSYQFLDPGDRSVIPDSTKLYLLCDYGTGVRPLAHGPITPMAYEAGTDGDEYWSNVALLLQFDGSIEDVSDNALTVTVNGGAAVSTDQSKWGGSSCYFDGVDDYLSVPMSSAFDMDGDITIEGWLFASSVANNPHLVDARVNAFTSGYMLNITGGVLRHLWANTTTGAFYNLYGATQIPLETWQHFALVKKDNNLSLFLNGRLDAHDAAPDTYYASASGNLLIASPNKFSGHLDDFRITKGVARYSPNFTVPTEAFPADSTDEYWNDVVLLLPGDSSTNDASPLTHTVTASGAVVSAAEKKFGAGSIYFDGSNDYLSIPNTVDGLSEDAFTIEFWVKRSNTSNHCVIRTITNVSSGVYNGFQIILTNGIYIELYNGAESATIYRAESFGTDWHHVVFSFNGACYYTAFDGAAMAHSPAVLIGANTQPFIVGQAYTGIHKLEGYIDDLRITKGVARYGKFDVPTKAFPTTGLELVDEWWEHVVLLLPFDGSIEDVSDNALLISTNGGVTTSTAQSKWGRVELLL